MHVYGCMWLYMCVHFYITQTLYSNKRAPSTLEDHHPYCTPLKKNSPPLDLRGIRSSFRLKPFWLTILLILHVYPHILNLPKNMGLLVYISSQTQLTWVPRPSLICSPAHLTLFSHNPSGSESWHKSPFQWYMVYMYVHTYNSSACTSVHRCTPTTRRGLEYSLELHAHVVLHVCLKIYNIMI